MKKLIIFLVRLKLGLKKYERFQFANQKNKDEQYYFSEDALLKMRMSKHSGYSLHLSGVSLNWLLSDDCKIKKVGASE